jgi:hypothetical protein
VAALAGRDISLRARGSAELSTASGDLRLKAEGNLHALAGNSGTGGLLLESRGADAYAYKDAIGTDVVSGGIQLKSAGSVVAWADGYYIRALHEGDIVLDADRGNGDIYQWCSTATRYLGEGAADYFGTPTKVEAASTFARTGAVLAGGVAALGDCAFAGGLTTAYYGPGRPGDTTLIGEVAFSFRSTDQYRARDFCCWEASWQQQARLGGLELGTWSEPPVAAGNQITYPYPGAQAWATDEDYLRQDLLLYDAKAGHAVDRAKHRADYEAPAFKAPRRSVLDGNYAIVDPQ